MNKNAIKYIFKTIIANRNKSIDYYRIIYGDCYLVIYFILYPSHQNLMLWQPQVHKLYQHSYSF